MKIVILDGYVVNPGDLSWEGLEILGNVQVYDRTPRDLTAERIGDADAVLTNKTVLDDSIFAETGNLKYIGVLATGYDIVDVAAAGRRGITVTNVPAYSTPAVAQMVFALILEICNNVGAHSIEVFGGTWSKNPDFSFWKYPIIELAGKTMGIVGLGSIGRHTAHIGQAFGMNILAARRSPEKSYGETGITVTGYDRVFAESDIISLHCPLNASTERMINSSSIAKMKDGVILINTSRGGLVDEKDLADALDSGKVAAAGIDVMSSEPPDERNPLFGARNLFITPHIAWAARESRKRLIDTAVSNIRSFIDGNAVNTVGR